MTSWYIINFYFYFHFIFTFHQGLSEGFGGEPQVDFDLFVTAAADVERNGRLAVAIRSSGSTAAAIPPTILFSQTDNQGDNDGREDERRANADDGAEHGGQLKGQRVGRSGRRGRRRSDRIRGD